MNVKDNEIVYFSGEGYGNMPFYSGVQVLE